MGIREENRMREVLVTGTGGNKGRKLLCWWMKSGGRRNISQVILCNKALGRSVAGRSPGGGDGLLVEKLARTRWRLVLQNTGFSWCCLSGVPHVYHKLCALCPCTKHQDSSAEVGAQQAPWHLSHLRRQGPD